VIRSVLIKLAMLSATLSVIVWIGWTVPPNPGEAGLEGASTVLKQGDIAPSPAARHEVVAPPSPPIGRPTRAVSSQPEQRSVTAQYVDMNHASVREFDQLPGIGPALAERIIEHRRSHGPFTAIEDLLLVKGIGSKKLDRLRGLVSVRSETKRDTQEGRL
jgi:competence protein ComEA